MSADQKIKDSDTEGWFVFSVTALDSHQLRWWLLSQGDSLEVLSPKSIRDWFTEISINLSSFYQN